MSLTEVVDFSKDIYYCYSVNHIDKYMTILLWIFALSLFLFKFLTITTMTTHQYVQSFGNKDILNLPERNYRLLRFFLIKIKRAFKEIFLNLDKEDW